MLTEIFRVNCSDVCNLLCDASKKGRLMGGQRIHCIDRYLIKKEHKMLMIQFYSVYKGGHLKVFSTSLCV